MYYQGRSDIHKFFKFEANEYGLIEAIGDASEKRNGVQVLDGRTIENSDLASYSEFNILQEFVDQISFKDFNNLNVPSNYHQTLEVLEKYDTDHILLPFNVRVKDKKFIWWLTLFAIPLRKTDIYYYHYSLLINCKTMEMELFKADETKSRWVKKYMLSAYYDDLFHQIRRAPKAK